MVDCSVSIRYHMWLGSAVSKLWPTHLCLMSLLLT